ncbi:MAG TPA: hypothetical protein VGJ46_11575 [Candidatus Limnocylindrales bacterium]
MTGSTPERDPFGPKGSAPGIKPAVTGFGLGLEPVDGDAAEEGFVVGLLGCPVAFVTRATGFGWGVGVGRGVGVGVGRGVAGGAGAVTEIARGLTLVSVTVRAPFPEPLDAMKLYECTPAGSVSVALNVAPAWKSAPPGGAIASVPAPLTLTVTLVGAQPALSS